MGDREEWATGMSEPHGGVGHREEWATLRSGPQEEWATGRIEPCKFSPQVTVRNPHSLGH